jgi:hypothetical protein
VLSGSRAGEPTVELRDVTDQPTLRGAITDVKPAISEVVERLRQSRAVPWLRVIDDAGLDDPAEDEPDPGAVVKPYRWLLKRIGSGVRLTEAGYLPPRMVTEAMAALEWEEDWIGTHNRENLAIPILELRESAQRLRLVRKNRGDLLVTKVGRRLLDDPSGLWWHIAERLPDAVSEPQRHGGALSPHGRGRPPQGRRVAGRGDVDPGLGRPGAHAAESVRWVRRRT